MKRWVFAALILGITGPASAEGGSILRIYSCQQKSLTTAWVQKFQQENPLIQVELQTFTHDELKQKLAKEFQSGASIADIIMVDNHELIQTLKSEQRLLPFKDVDVSPLYPQLRDPDSYCLPTKLVLIGLAYHTNSKKPSSWNDLLNHEGPVAFLNASTEGAQGFIYTALADNMGMSYLKALSKNTTALKPTLSACLRSLIAEEAKIAIAAYHSVIKARQEGINTVRFAIPHEGMIPLIEPMAILKTAQNLEDALQWCRFIISESGQHIVTSQGFVSCRTNTPTPVGYLSSKSLILLPAFYQAATSREVAEQLKNLTEQRS
jgi:iron(III) transport system substrate-binding protein